MHHLGSNSYEPSQKNKANKLTNDQYFDEASKAFRQAWSALETDW